MEITETIHQLQIDFEIPASPGKTLSRFVNVLIVFGEKITIIDTGVKGSEKFIFDYIERQGRKCQDIETVILTHSHPDQMGSAAKIKESTGCRIVSHPLEKNWIEDIELQNKQRPVSGFFTLVDSSVRVNEFIDDDELLKLADKITLRCIHTPGHSKGMMNLLFIEDKILFAADAIPLKGDIPNYNNYTELKDSLKRIKNMGNFTTLLTSWTSSITDSGEMFRLFIEGEKYLEKLDEIVKKHYKGNVSNTSMENCKNCIAELGMPSFLVNPIVHSAFRSHFV